MAGIDDLRLIVSVLEGLGHALVTQIVAWGKVVPHGHLVGHVTRTDSVETSMHCCTGCDMSGDDMAGDKTSRHSTMSGEMRRNCGGDRQPPMLHMSTHNLVAPHLEGRIEILREGHPELPMSPGPWVLAAPNCLNKFKVRISNPEFLAEIAGKFAGGGHRSDQKVKTMSKLHELFPTAESLLELTPQDLAPVLLRLARDRRETGGRFWPDSVTEIGSPGPIGMQNNPYPHHQKCRWRLC